MKDYIIYHNPRCRKSREALNFLTEKGIEAEVVQYIKHPLTVKEFKLLLARLNIGPQELLRKGERIFKDRFKTMKFNDDEWIDIMIENPQLIERPIVVKGNKAVIGRPLERVVELVG